MRVRVDIHVESDGGAVETWITLYDAEGHQQECYSTHDQKVLCASNSLLETLAIVRQGHQLRFDPF